MMTNTNPRCVIGTSRRFGATLTLNASSRFRKSKRGLTLLEVMLSLVIIGISLAILNQAMHLAAENGLRSEKMNAAQMIAESTMAEVVAGAKSLQVTSWQPVSLSFSDTQWYCMIQQMPAEQLKMICIQVMVTDDPTRKEERPIDVTMTRWIIDPTLGLDTLQSQTNGQTGTGQSGTSGTGQSSSGSASGGLQ